MTEDDDRANQAGQPFIQLFDRSSKSCFPIKGKGVQFRTTNQFHCNDQAEWWSEFSADDGKTWTKAGERIETREKNGS